MLVSAVVGSLMLPVSALAAAGSLVSGVVWADTDRDGVHDAEELTKPGVTVELLSAGGTVIATALTDGAGAYSFPDVPDGTYTVRVAAEAPYRFPATASGDNDFARTGTPPPGQPERGVTGPITIAGATQVTGLDAGMQPIATLTVEELPVADGCDGTVTTGTPPFDPADGAGQDSGPGNCVVRVNDTVSQNFSVGLTGLPSGASVANVVAEFTISSPDGAELELVGPSANGLPAGCLGAANGADPPSSRTVNPDGSITVICNIGTMSSNVAALQLAYKFQGDTPIPSHASVEMHAFAAEGDAGTSNPVQGPLVEVTGTAQWDLEKRAYPATSNGAPGPDFTVLNGQEGYFIRYEFRIDDLLDGAGGSDLVWPATFTDVMPGFPNAQIVECRSNNSVDVGGTSPWTLTCPLNQVQGADGWELSIAPNSGDGSDTGLGIMVMKVFVPLEEMNRAIDPTWVAGDPIPTGTFDFDNRAQDTDTWMINGGALNFGDGHEPGWDGTGDNLATMSGTAAAPQWDLQKAFSGGPAFSTRTINGQQVDGYIIDYTLTVRDLAGPDNVGPWLDRPVTFKDRLTSHPGAHLLQCYGTNWGNGTCETGAQPVDGWDMSFVPNQRAFDDRVAQFHAQLFIPLSEMPSDPCENDVTLDLRNEAVGSEHWTAQGQPNNGTGFEPGWDGTTATGNNLDVRSIRPSVNECGSLTGNKNFFRNGSTVNGGTTFGGDTNLSWVSSNANNNRVVVDDLRLCDVFDVSVFSIASTPSLAVNPAVATTFDASNYVIEYAVGPNQVDTQAGALDPVSGLYPIDRTSLDGAVVGCRDDAGPWVTDPEASFGADWRDQVNMVRVREIDPAHVETGPWDIALGFNLETRTFYNGGPNAGEAIPSGVRTFNEGGWPTGRTGATWTTGAREMFFRGMQLAIQKTVSPTQYLPGSSVVWNLNVQANRTTVGATMRNLQVVDTIPENLHFDLACTQDLLPPGVTVGYDPSTRQATFSAGDIEITVAPNQVLFSDTDASVEPLRICTTVDSLAQPGDTYVNQVLAMADNSENTPTADATIQVVGSGQMGISKTVDKPYVTSGEEYTWSLDWGNTSTVLGFAPPDVIDVLPWNGDGAPDALSGRDQVASDYQGLAQITGPLAAPTYVRGGTGVGDDVAGTWYYTTANPSTIDHDARAAANTNPQAPGGLWLTAAEVSAGAGFGAVTAVRFVSSEFLTVQTRVRAVIPAVSTSTALDNLYVNRAMIFSATFANQPLLSNEPFVQMPGWTIGDLVWIDTNADGIHQDDEAGVAGVVIQIRDAAGNVVATTTTDAEGRWTIGALPPGTFTVHIPASQFQPGGPLAGMFVPTAGAGSDPDANEDTGNNNTATPNPTVTGLSSTPVTFAYRRDEDGNLIGGNSPLDDDVAGLADPLITDDFTFLTLDLAVAPAPGVDIEKSTNGADADNAPGPLITPGGAVRWTYVVTNTGLTDLTNVTVTDNLVAADQIDCDGTDSNIVAGPLAPGASFTCVATGTAITGQYTNTGTVTGLDPTGIEVTDNDPSHYFGGVTPPEFDLTVDKRVVGSTRVTVGEKVRYRIQVTNRGPDLAPAPIKLVDPLPTGLELISAKGKDWDCTTKKATDVVRCKRDTDLAPGKKAAPIYVVAKTTKAAIGKERVNVAEVSADGDTVKSNNQDVAGIQVTNPPPLPATGFRFGIGGLF